jgi:hypothetical protein
MITKNVYILYPAGYSGSYLNWSINISDNDLHNTTVKDPINISKSPQYGGSGTSHNHVRVPTHQDIFKHFAWTVLNRPVDKKIYIINVGKPLIDQSISYLMQSDPTGVIVVIHNNNDRDVDAYGTINCITKWHTYARLRARMFDLDSVTSHIDFFESSRGYRNFIVNQHARFFLHMNKIDYDSLSQELSKAADWYQIRNKFQPHEVNESGYVTDFSLDRRLFEISCADIASKYFPEWLEKFMHDSSVSDAYDCSHVTNYHDNYVNAQENLKWFDSIKSWEATGELNSYLTSHCGIEAHVILRMFENSNNHGLGVDWENMSVEEINQVYQDSKQKKEVV